MTRILAAIALSTLAMGCARSTPAAPPVEDAPRPAPQAAPPAAPPQPGDPLEPSLNLSFERGMEGWHTGGEGYVVEASAEGAHDGTQGLHLGFREAVAGRSFAVATVRLPVDKARERTVHMSGWLRTRDVTGYAGLWLRVDGADGMISLENMHEGGPKGTTEWRRYQIDVPVPPEASAIFCGVLMAGSGDAWADDLRFDFEAQKAPRSVRIQGMVRGPDGKAVDGAIVAAVGKVADAPSAIATSDAAGRFAFTVTSGEYAFTATSAAGSAAYADVRLIQDDASVDLALTNGGFTVTGSVKSPQTLPAGAQIMVTRWSDVYGDIFVVPVDAQGAFRVRLPEARAYTAMLSTSASDRIVAKPLQLAGKGDQMVTIDAVLLAPPPADVVAWVSKSAVRLRTTEAEHGFDDMAGVAPLVKGARIVALGEATHGTREFFQLKHRFLEYLVEKQGFTLFAIEANLTETRRVNDYVLGGPGDARKVLAGMYFWTWDTEEVLAQIEWMRAYNTNPKHARKVQFLGFDMQTTKVAWPNVKDYLGRVDPAWAASLPASLDFFIGDPHPEQWKALPAEQRVSMMAAVDAVVARLDASRGELMKKTSAREWRAAREDARLVAQNAHMLDGESYFDGRDVAMAENIGWILDHEAKGAKLVVWAHNGHIARAWTDETVHNMGSHLTRKYGKAYLPVGFVFAEGSFQAMGAAGVKPGLNEWTLGPARDTDVSQAFTRAGCELCVVDLRTAPRGAVADYFAAPHFQRETGAIFSTEDNMTALVQLSARFDAIIFVHKTTRARPVRGGD